MSHRPCLATNYSNYATTDIFSSGAQFHVVTFDADGKITTIQQSWDQGAMLKQLDVIGKTGRNWPIRDSQDQIKLITKTRGQAADPITAKTQTVQRPRENSTNATRDPHATLFNSRAEEADRVVSPFSGTRPRQRTFEEILGDDPALESPEHQSPSKAVAPKNGAGKNFQPSRLFDKADDEVSTPKAPKNGAGKNYHPSRLFDKDEDEDAPSDPESPQDGKTPSRFMKPHPKKYNHFEFSDGTDPADAPQAGVAFDDIKSKHRQTWSFEDFVTPQKVKPAKSLRQQARHWGTDENDIDESPAKPVLHHNKPRRDADTQIELQDDGEDDPRSQRAGARPRGAMHNSGLGLYKNHMVTDDGSEPVQSPDPRTLGNITNLKNRSNHFDPHFDMNDESPRQESHKADAPIADDRKKAVNMMQANWSAYDESPGSQKENNKPPSDDGPRDLQENDPNHRIRLGGDGMGNPKNGRWQQQDGKGGIKLGGDGMGNPKGGRGWSLGDDSDEEKQAAPVPGRKGAGVSGAAQKAANNFWDF